MAESQNIEYKESWHDEYLRWICGFANAQGGKLYIGIDDKGHVCGFPNSKKLLEDIPNKVRNTLGIVVDVNLCSTAKATILRLLSLHSHILFHITVNTIIEAVALSSSLQVSS